MFDEQPDADPHGECAREIARLKKDNERLKAMVARYVDIAAMDQMDLDTLYNQVQSAP